MFGSAILDVSIGLILVYLLFSLVCSALMEAVELVARSRAKDLERGIRAMLNDETGEGLVASIYNHPLIAGLYDGGYNRHPKKLVAEEEEKKKEKEGMKVSTVTLLKEGIDRKLSYLAPSSLLSDGDHDPNMPTGWWKNLPSYVPASNFALALLDITTRGTPSFDPNAARSTSPSISMLNLRRSVESMNNPPVQRVLLTALDTAQGDLVKAQRQLEAWYDSSMERVAGWYKKRLQVMLLWSGLAVALLANVNTLRIARYLYHDKTARDALVAQATTVSKDSAILNANVKEVRAAIDSLKLPIGWEGSFMASISLDPTRRDPTVIVGARPSTTRGKDAPNPVLAVVFALVGWFATALAISLGAPFWFDLLNKFMVVRSTVKPLEKSPEESSKDRQTGSGAPARNGATQTAGQSPIAQAPVDERADFEGQAWATGNDPQEGVL